ncbi:hypothetical protein PVL29_022891 [Vitis rotundifolia]|uniref:Uncharacterized protein n=1 Tax=Vitis rotundifolia TaxID=103349 RepID=A0AA39DC43_VITRO|nr:hypothetical protein PVL29_022891 [Vitis rotundifolia]
MSLYMSLIQKIDVAHCHLQIEGGVNIPITCTHIEQVFGIPLGGRKLVLDSHRHHDGRTENAKEFHQLFIIFACTTVLTSTMRLEGHHALWHAPPKAVTWDFHCPPLYERVENNGPTNHNNATMEMGTGNESFQAIVAHMEATCHQIDATQTQMNNLTAAYGRNLIALKNLQPSPSILVDEDFQPFENMADVVEPVVERPVDEAIVEGMMMLDHQTVYLQGKKTIVTPPKFQTSYLLNLTKKK